MSFTLNNKTFEELNVVAATYKEDISGVTSLQLTVDQDLTSGPIFDVFSMVTLKSGSTTLFVGWLDKYPKQATPTSTGWTYVINGPIRWIRASNYKQNFVTSVPGGTFIDIGPNGLTMLGRKVNTDGSQVHVSLLEAVTSVLTFAQTDKGNFTFNISSPLDPNIPWDPRQDDNCQNALYTLLKWSPEVVLQWTQQALELFSPDLDAPGAKVFSEQLGLRDDLKITPDHDLLVSQTIITYLQKAGGVGSDVSYAQVQDISMGPVPGDAADSPQTAEVSIYLEEGESLPDFGLADQFQRWAEQLQFTGSGVIDALNWDNRAGDVWQFGGLFAFANKKGVCKSVSRDLFTLAETISFGPPLHLNLGDYVALRRKPSRQPSPGEGNPSQQGQLTVFIKDPDGNMIDGATWSAGGKNGDNGATVKFPIGTLTVSVTPPLDYKQPFPNPTQSAIILAAGAATNNFECPWRTKLKLKDDGQDDPTSITLDTQDLVDLGLPIGHAEAKLRVVDILVDGALLKTVALIVDPYTEDDDA